MSVTAANKEIVTSFFNQLNARDFDGAFGMLAEDLEWWILGHTKLSGAKDKRFISMALKTILQRTFKGYQFELGTFTAEEDRVSVTAESNADHKNGKHYNNHFHFLFTIRDGKIARVKEYFDTDHALWIEKPPG